MAHKFENRDLDLYLNVADQAGVVSTMAESGLDDEFTKRRLDNAIDVLTGFYRECVSSGVPDEQLHGLLERTLPPEIAGRFKDDKDTDSIA